MAELPHGLAAVIRARIADHSGAEKLDGARRRLSRTPSGRLPIEAAKQLLLLLITVRSSKLMKHIIRRARLERAKMDGRADIVLKGNLKIELDII